jgi:hypothetical protein
MNQVTGEAAGEIAHLAPDVEMLARRLAAVDYLVDEGLATALFLSLRLPQPLLLEGEAGVGKTEAGKSLAAVLDTPLVRLQCYEGIDAACTSGTTPASCCRSGSPRPAAPSCPRTSCSGLTTSTPVRCCARCSTRARARRCC